MKLFLILSAVIFFASCNTEKRTLATPVKADTVFIVRDSAVYIPVFDYAMKDSMISEMNALKDSLFAERYKIERVRYYMKICMHKPSQTKFLIGWIKRATD